MSTSGGFYFASKVKHAERWKRLREAGTPIVCTWIDEAGEGQTASYSELASRCLAEIERAWAVVLYCEPGEVLKGALIEAGIALATKIPVYCVGSCDSLSRVFVQHPLWHAAETVEAAIVAATPDGSLYATINDALGLGQDVFPSVACDCDPEGNFECGDKEHALRLISSGKWPHGPMTPEQRRWCIQEADSAGEGSWSEEELAKLNDQDLAKAVLQAWWDYVRSNCL